MSFSIEQFTAVFRACEEARQSHIIIGVQSVYFWASRYSGEENVLEQSRPFTSKDIDFHGRRDDVLRLAKQLGAPAKFPPTHMMTSLAGIIPLTIGSVKTNVEFVRQVAGVRSVDASKFAVARELDGIKLRILDPVSLLLCKASLAVGVDQKQRRDVEHLRILIVRVRSFLRETLAGVEAGELPARGWLGAVERVFKFADSTIGKKASRKLKVVWHDALPEKELAGSKQRLVAQFRRVRLPQWLEKQTCAR